MGKEVEAQIDRNWAFPILRPTPQSDAHATLLPPLPLNFPSLARAREYESRLLVSVCLGLPPREHVVRFAPRGIRVINLTGFDRDTVGYIREWLVCRN